MDISVDLYESLPLENETDIRLLTLHSGAGIDQITCSLVKADLDINLLSYDPLQYEALSYCWESPEITDHININNRSVKIRNNLWWALMYMREVNNDRILWVDALCINQNDIRERNHQVGLMGEIYSRAFAVLAWLGCEEDGCYLVMDFLRNKMREDEFKLGREHSALFPAVVRDYWTRVWILQEFVLASSVTVHCGTKAVDWMAFELVGKQEGRDLIVDPARAVGFNRSSRRKQRRNPADPCTPLLDLMALFSNRHCMDPRDMVYGLLGMAAEFRDHSNPLLGFLDNTPDFRDDFTVDYSKSVFATYFEVFQLYYQSGPRLNSDLVGELALVLQCYLQASCTSSFGCPGRFVLPDYSTFFAGGNADVYRQIAYRDRIPYEEAKMSLVNFSSKEGLSEVFTWLQEPCADSEATPFNMYRRWPLEFPNKLQQLSKLHLILASNLHEVVNEPSINIVEDKIRVVLKVGIFDSSLRFMFYKEYTALIYVPYIKLRTLTT
ncbi:Heterokaryon incompatibility protein (HET) domain containing protein [Hyaloscypha variabilis]